MLMSRFSHRRIGSPPMIGTITSGCRGKAVAPHHRCNRGEVGWASGRSVEDGRNLAEVVGAEDSGCHDRQRLRIDIARVVELVDGATWTETRLSGSDIDLVAHRRCHHCSSSHGLVKWLDGTWRRATSQAFLLTPEVTRNGSGRRS